MSSVPRSTFREQDRDHGASFDETQRPLDVESRQMGQNQCPTCGETVHAAAIHCRFCGNQLDPSEWRRKRLRPRRTTRPFPPADVISEAWQLYVDQLGLSIGSFIAVLLMSVLIASVPYGPRYLAESMADQGNDLGSLLAFVVTTVLYLTAAFAIVDLYSGYLILQLKIVREQPVELTDLFPGGRFVSRLIISSILVGLAGAIGLTTCIVPGVLIAIVFSPYALALVDEDLPGIDCLWRAKQLTDGNWLSIVLVFLVSLAAAVMGTTACFVGLIAAIPFINLLFAVQYDWMTTQIPYKPLWQDAQQRIVWPSMLRAATRRRGELNHP